MAFDIQLNFDYQQLVTGLSQMQADFQRMQSQVAALANTGNAAFDALARAALAAGNATNQSAQSINQYRATIATLTAARDEAFDVTVIANYNRQIAAARVAMQGLESGTGQAKGKLQLMREELQRLGAARDEAFDVLDIERYNREIQVAQGNLQRLERQGLAPLNQGATLGDKIFTKLVATIAAIGVVTVFKNIGQEAINAAKDYETSTIAFEVLAGSAAAAARLQGELIAFVAKTPFELPDVQAATKSLLAFGFSAKDAVPELQRLGNIAAAVNIPITDLATIYGKNKLGGFIQAEDLRQLAERGIPVFESLARQLGVNTDKVKEMGSANKITFGNLKVAFDELGGAGGRFYGLIDKQSQTLEGRLSNLRDDAREAARAFGEGFNESLKELTISASAFFKSLDKDTLTNLGKSIGETVKFVISFGKEMAYLATGVTIFKSLQFVVKGLIPIYNLATGAQISYVGATNQATAATERLNLATKRSFWGAIATAAIFAVVYAIDKYTDSVEKAKEAEERANAVRKEVVDAVQKEAGEVNDLFEVLRNGNTTQKQRHEAAQVILKQYPDLLGNIKTEAELMRDLDKAQNLVIDGLVRQAAAQVKANAYREYGNSLLETEIKKKKFTNDLIKVDEQIAKTPKTDSSFEEFFFGKGNVKTADEQKKDKITKERDKFYLEAEQKANDFKENLSVIDNFTETLAKSIVKTNPKLDQLSEKLSEARKIIQSDVSEDVKEASRNTIKTLEIEFDKEVAAINGGGAGVAKATENASKEQLNARKKATEELKRYEKKLQDDTLKLQKQKADDERALADREAVRGLEGEALELKQQEQKYTKQIEALEVYIVKKEKLNDLEIALNTAVYSAMEAETEKSEAEIFEIKLKYLKESVKSHNEKNAIIEKYIADGLEKEIRASERETEAEREKLEKLGASKDVIEKIYIKHFENIKKIEEKFDLENLKTFESNDKGEVGVIKKALDAELEVAESLFKSKQNTKKKEESFKKAQDLQREINAETIAKRLLEIELFYAQKRAEITGNIDQDNLDNISNKIKESEKKLEAYRNRKPEDEKAPDFSKEGLFTKLTGSEKQGKALGQLTDLAITHVNALADAYVDAADKAVDAADRRVDAAQNALETEIELAKLGYANNVTLKQQELADAKVNQAKALEDQREATNIKIALDSIQQGASLATAAAQIMATFGGTGIGIPIAIGLIGAMFAAFAASKAQIKDATKYEHGGEAYYENGIIRGNRHSDGGVGIEVEGGEAVIAGSKRISIVNRKMTAKHHNLLGAINQDNHKAMAMHLEALLDRPTFNYAIVGQMQDLQQQAAVTQYNNAFVINTEKMESLLKQQIQAAAQKNSTVVVGNKTIIQKGNHIRTINNRN